MQSTIRRNRLLSRNCASVTVHRVEQLDGLGRLGTRRARLFDQRWPHEMDPATRVYGHRGSVVGTAFEHPVVLADTDGRDKTASAVLRHRERHVAEVAGIHVTPRGVYRSAAGTH